MGVETLGFDQGLTVEPESALAAVLGGFFEDALLRAGRGGKDKEFAVRKDAINIEEQQFDFARALERRVCWASWGILAGGVGRSGRRDTP